METTHQDLSTSDVWKSHWPWSRYNEVICQLHIWPWSFEHSRSQTYVPMEITHQGLSTSRSRQQTNVTMEKTHQGLSTSEVWKSYWPLCKYNEVKCQLHIWPWNLEHSRSRLQTKVMMERTHQGLSTPEVLKSYDHGLGTMKLNTNNRLDLETWNFQGQCPDQTKVTMGRTHQGLSTSEVWKSYWPLCKYNEVKCQWHIWPWNLEHSRSRSQTKVALERTHQGLSTSQ